MLQAAMQAPKQGAAEEPSGPHADAGIGEQDMEPSEGDNTVPGKPPLQENELMEDAPPGDAPAEDTLPGTAGIPMDSAGSVASGSIVEQSSPSEDEHVHSDSSGAALELRSGASTGIEEQLGNLELGGAEQQR